MTYLDLPWDSNNWEVTGRNRWNFCQWVLESETPRAWPPKFIAVRNPPEQNGSASHQLAYISHANNNCLSNWRLSERYKDRVAARLACFILAGRLGQIRRMWWPPRKEILLGGPESGLLLCPLGRRITSNPIWLGRWGDWIWNRNSFSQKHRFLGLSFGLIDWSIDCPKASISSQSIEHFISKKEANIWWNLRKYMGLIVRFMLERVNPCQKKK